jgi:lipopolysaccharide exporter
MIPVLQILAMLGVPRTVIWTCNSYLQVRDRPRVIMNLETARMIGIVVLMHLCTLAALAFVGPARAVLFACASVVTVFSLSAFTYMLAIRELDRVPLIDQIRPILSPVVACIPMALAVYGVREALALGHLLTPDHPLLTKLDHVRIYGPRLLLEIVVGAVVFVPSALLLAPGASRELLALVRDALKRRRAGADHPEGTSPAPAPEAP